MTLKGLGINANGNYMVDFYRERFFSSDLPKKKVLLLIQGVSQHWTPKNLAKSQALYKIRHLDNFQVSS